MLALALRRSFIVGLALLVVVVVTVPLVPATRMELIAPYDNGMITVRIVAAPSTSMSSSNE